MTSGYALPGAGSHHQFHHGHAYSHSYSGAYLSPSEPLASNTCLAGNGHVKKAVSHGNLYTHAETSRETTPLSSPSVAQFEWPSHQRAQSHSPLHPPPPEVLARAIAGQHHTHSHHHPHDRIDSPMRARARGESDLGRPAAPNGHTYKPGLSTIPSTRFRASFAVEALTGLLIPLPYLLASAAYSYTVRPAEDDGLPPLSAYKQLQQHVFSDSWNKHDPVRYHGSGTLEALTLTAGTLVAVGLCGRLVRNKAKEVPRRTDIMTIRSLSSKLLGVGLPFYASMRIGGVRTGMVLLSTVAAGLTSSTPVPRPSIHEWKHLLSQRIATLAAILLCICFDLSGLTILAKWSDLFMGYSALIAVIIMAPYPLPPANSKAEDSANLVLGVGAGLIAGIMAFSTSAFSSITSTVFTFGALSILATTAGTLMGPPTSLRSEWKPGLGIGCLVTAACAFLFSPSTLGTICNGGLSALAFVGVLFDTTSSPAKLGGMDHRHDHAHGHNHGCIHAHGHSHHHESEAKQSAFTKSLLSQVQPGSLMHSILVEKDSRRIAYFTTLNFAFMFVQGVYGYLSGSLGLLSDTVHMFFDCLALVVGLAAAVASKWPTSPEKPYGWGKLNTLAGFGNGIFLMLVSVEFVWEAVEGLLEGKELRHVKELLVVSTLGLVVNLIGLFAFGHAHAGHDHGHSHGHSHGGHHDHGHDHHNENMHGIFLHVAADAGGSLAVIISTALTLWKPSYAWDPLAAIVIAVLIFAAAVPLVTASGQKLLLVIPDDLEYNIKNALQGLSEIRGVVGYAAPRFWVDDKEEASEAHGHEHHHHHSHSHSHNHDHGHHHDSDHDHGRDHDHQNEHDASKRIMGVIHIIAAYSADLEDVRERVADFVQKRNMDLVIHVEREGDIQCWCGGAQN